MLSLFYQRETLALQIFVSIDVLKHILIIRFVHELRFHMRSSFNCCRYKKTVVFVNRL